MQEISEQVLQKITPSREDRAKVDANNRELEQKVAAACEQEGVLATVRVEGSVAKDTWLRENLTLTFSCVYQLRFREKT